MITVLLSITVPARFGFAIRTTEYTGHIDLLAKPSKGDILDFGVNNDLLPESILRMAQGSPVILKVQDVTHKVNGRTRLSGLTVTCTYKA